MRSLLTLALLLTLSLRLSAEEITVYAAASLTDVLKEIAAGYEKTSGDKIIFNFAASSTLAVQIKAGAPADLFFSADEAKMDDLAKHDLIVKESRHDLLSNRLVIIAPSASTLALKAPADLTGPDFKKLALGETKSVPAGIYARAFLEKAGLWEKLSARVIPMENVRAVLAAVETDNVEVGFVYATDALLSTKAKVLYEVPAADAPPIVYPVALLKEAKHAAAAAKFLEVLQDPASLKTFQKFGFITKT